MPTPADLIASYLRSRGIRWLRVSIDTEAPRISIVANEGGTRTMYVAGSSALVDEAKNFGARSRLVALSPSLSPAPWIDAVALLMGIAEAITDAVNRYVSNPFSVPTMLKSYLYSVTSIDSALVNYSLRAIADFIRNGRPVFIDLFLKAYMNWSVSPNPPQITTPPPITIVFV